MGIPGKSKIPLRGIGKLFTHLDAGVRAKLESAFVEAEDQINYHNRSAINTQERRVPSAYVTAPVIVLTTNSRGFDVTWERLNDRHISFYEAQVDLTSSFATPTTYNLAETSLTVEGVGTNVYIRVRGVRWDGATGNWSNTVFMDSATGGPVTYSKGLDDVSHFYVDFPGLAFPGPLQQIVITPQRQNGGLVIFGSLATDPTVLQTSEPAVALTLNGVDQVLMSINDYFQIGGSGSAGCGIGPIFVGHDQFYFGDSNSSTANTNVASGTADSSGIHTDWNVGNPSSYSVLWNPAGSPVAASTRYNNFGSYAFSIASGNEIIGIEVSYTATDNAASGSLYDSARALDIHLVDAGVVESHNKGSLAQDVLWGVGTITKGGRSDLWGRAAGYWTADKINDPNFGVQVRGRVYAPSGTNTRTISLTRPIVRVFFVNETTGEVDVQIRFQADPLTGPLLACTLNVIEFGDSL